MADYDVDLFVIGGGSGGVRAARVAAQHGARVMLAEEYRLGGTCVIRGCVPKKLFVYAARFRGEFEDAAGYGWTLSHPSFDWPTLIANKDREIARLEAAYAATLDKAGVAIVKSRAVLAHPHTVQLANGDRVRAAYVLISTGGAPSYGDQIPGIAHAISSNEAFHLPELPRRVLIQGGSYIAVEFAGIFAGLGSQVTLVYRGENILRGFDDDVRHHLRMDMEKHGIRVITGCKVAAIERGGAHFSARLSSGNQIPADCVMFAVGRRPNVAKLGLKEAGVEIAKNGGIAVDEYSRTTVANIYAVGDVTNRVNLTPVAIREGHAFADTLFGGKPTAVDHTNVPTAVFSDPEVGAVGLTETQARARLAQTDVYKAMFKPLKATLSGRDTTVLLKLVVDGLTGRVVGCHVVGEGAAEMVQLAAIAVKMRATKADFDATMALHPTTAEELVTMRQKSASYARAAAESGTSSGCRGREPPCIYPAVIPAEPR
ncbi:MAG: glutathione-disulfide reductase [Xanthobacteraceae bacterium]